MCRSKRICALVYTWSNLCIEKCLLCINRRRIFGLKCSTWAFDRRKWEHAEKFLQNTLEFSHAIFQIYTFHRAPYATVTLSCTVSHVSYTRGDNDVVIAVAILWGQVRSRRRKLNSACRLLCAEFRNTPTANRMTLELFRMSHFQLSIFCKISFTFQ